MLRPPYSKTIYKQTNTNAGKVNLDHPKISTIGIQNKPPSTIIQIKNPI